MRWPGPIVAPQVGSALVLGLVALLSGSCVDVSWPTDPPDTDETDTDTDHTDVPDNPCGYPEACPSTGGIEWTPGLKPDVMFMVDNNATMGELTDYPGLEDRTRAELVRELARLYLPQVNDLARLGLVVFPRDTGTEYIRLSVEDDPDRDEVIVATLETLSSPSGRALVLDAVDAVADTCFAHPDFDNIAILVTDGQGLQVPECGDDLECEQAAISASMRELIPSRSAKVELYVLYVGVSTAEVPARLQRLADASLAEGTPAPVIYDVNQTEDPAALQQRLFDTLQGRGACSFALEEDVTVETLSVTLDGAALESCAEDAPETCTGFRVESKRVVRLSGEACPDDGLGRCPNISFRRE